jgi:hypothetical protein
MNTANWAAETQPTNNCQANCDDNMATPRDEHRMSDRKEKTRTQRAERRTTIHYRDSKTFVNAI